MSEKKRMANLELLRCVAMMMVVVLHYLGKGRLLPELTAESMNSAGAVAWLLESFCIVAVNVYMFISGYFLCTSSFRLSRLLRLLIQIWLYSAAFGILGAVTGVIAETPVDTHYFLTLIFPVSMGHYWFMTAYVFLYLLLPFVGSAVKRMTKQQMQLTVLLLLGMFCIMKSVLPLRLEMDRGGYDCLWYLCVFVAAAYVRRFGIPFLEKKGRALGLYVVCCLLAFAGTMGLRRFYLSTGRLEEILSVCMDYNHLLTFLAALGLFVFFSGLRIREKAATLINKISPYTLGVYLLHENLGLRYTWQRWLGSEKVSDVPGLLLWTLLAVICVFVCGILADVLRAGVMGLFHRLFGVLPAYRRLTEKVAAADELFRE